MKTKRKILVATLLVALFAIAVGGSLAWFSDTDEVKNTFTVGSVDIEQIEVFDEANAQLIPVVGDDPTVATDNYIEKNVTVKSVGENPAYVQTFFAVPKNYDDKGVLKLYIGDATDWEDPEEVATGVTIDGETMLYDVYRIRYTKALNKGDVTDACLEYVYIDKLVDIDAKDTNGDGTVDSAYLVAADGTVMTDVNVAEGQINVYVATQGVQSQGFADYESALNSGFPNHPWAN